MNNKNRAMGISITALVTLIVLSIILGLWVRDGLLGTVADWVEALSTFATLVITGFTAYLAYQKFLKEDVSTPSENQVIVFSTTQQTTELVATDEGLKLFLYDVRPNRRKGHQWTMTIDELSPIPEISVYPSATKEWGLFDVGYHTQWYYSKNIFPTEKELHDTIKKLIEKSIQLANQKG